MRSSACVLRTRGGCGGGEEEEEASTASILSPAGVLKTGSGRTHLTLCGVNGKDEVAQNAVVGLLREAEHVGGGILAAPLGVEVLDVVVVAQHNGELCLLVKAGVVVRIQRLSRIVRVRDGLVSRAAAPALCRCAAARCMQLQAGSHRAEQDPRIGPDSVKQCPVLVSPLGKRHVNTELVGAAWPTLAVVCGAGVQAARHRGQRAALPAPAGACTPACANRGELGSSRRLRRAAQGRGPPGPRSAGERRGRKSRAVRRDAGSPRRTMPRDCHRLSACDQQPEHGQHYPRVSPGAAALRRHEGVLLRGANILAGIIFEKKKLNWRLN